ncbi:unnamed protein product [Pieris macdunnoughi]|uniref:Uncharacterized protein n=1 Tax=Pieris macdunnoughi TaxID=345717 RepID=A0A821PHC3_9NEOP|nr:unnamed protein product [Pieris macdunnoughi]
MSNKTSVLEIKNICENVVTGIVPDNIIAEASNGAQIFVADMLAWTQPLQTGLPAFIVLFIGAWSDKTGNRKALMIIPILGETISAFGLFLATYFLLEWPLWVTAVGNLKNLYALKKYGMTNAAFSIFTTYSQVLGMAAFYCWQMSSNLEFIGSPQNCSEQMLRTYEGTPPELVRTHQEVFSKYLKMHDTLLGVIISISKILGNIFFALAPNVGWFYVAPIIEMFGNAGGVVAKSFGTKIVEVHEIGKICSLLAFMESISPVIYSPLFTKVYSITLNTMPEASLYLGGIMTVPGLFAYLALYFMHKRDERDVVKNPEANEEHAHENSVTVL